VEGWRPESYGDTFADVYDDWYGGPADAAAERLAALAGDGPVLELGVGTGRLALPLAARGLAVHGVDASAAMIERLRAKPGGELIRVTVGDMASDLPEEPFTLGFVAANTLFNLLSADAQRRCFRAVAERLAPGGRFVVEAFVPGEGGGSSSIEVRELARDRVVLSVARYDSSAQTADGQFVELTEAGGVRLRPWSIRWSTPAELDEMASAAGLTLEHRWSTWEGAPFSAESDHHVSVFLRTP
jgi:SAM-dependent methyltransferase